jgi:hypothetical protein
LVSSSAVFSPSGLKNSTMSVTRHKTTTTKKHWTRPTDTDEDTDGSEATATANSSHDAPSVNAATSRHQSPVSLAVLSAILGGVIFGSIVVLL